MTTVRCSTLSPWLAMGISVLILALLFAMSPAQAQILIDDFQPRQAELTGTGASTLSGAVLGGERDLQLTVTAGALSAGVRLGSLNITGDSSAAGTAEVLWDGVDHDATTIDTAGLGGVDLTAGDTDAFVLGINFLEGTPTVRLTVFSGSDASSIILNGLMPDSRSQVIRVPFVTLAGSADFTAVGAIRLQITDLAGAALSVDFLRTGSSAAATPVEALLTDVVLVDNDGNGKASPGDRLHYAVTIRNTGASTLTGVQFNAATPANTTLDSGSVKASPLARGEGAAADSTPGSAFHTALNVPLNVPDADAQDLLNNDFLGSPAAAITRFGGGTLGGTVDSNLAGSLASAGGHSLTVHANGSFTYAPAPGFTGWFTFQYRLANAVGSDTATVSIAVGTRPAAVTDSFSVTGNVQLNTETLGSILGNDIGDALALSGSTPPAHGSLHLDLGSGTFIYSPERGYNGPDSFTYTAGNGFGTSVGTVHLTVANMVWFIDAAAAGGDGRSHQPYRTVAAFNAVNSGTAGNPADGHVIILREGAYSDGLTLRNSQKVAGDGWSGSFLSAAGFAFAPGSAVAGFSGTDPVLAPSTGHGFQLAADNALRGLTVGNTPNGFGISGTAVGSLVVGECSKSGTGGAINITTSGAFGSNVAFDTLSSSSSTGANLNLAGITGTLTVLSPGSGFAGSAGGSAAVRISGGSLNFNYGGAVAKDNAGRVIDIQGATGGTIAFSGAISQTVTTGQGVLLHNNGGATIHFTGAITLSTGASAAFAATGGGTVTSSASGSTLTTTTGTALNVANTTIGSAGLKFQSITAGTGANGPVNAIVLNNTGTSGGLTVAGTGTAGSGGTIQRCSGDAILLTTTAGVSLTHMLIQNGNESGLAGSSVTGLNLAAVSITGNGDDSADDGIRIENLLGACKWTAVTVTGSARNNVWIRNSSGTLASLAITGGSFSSNGALFGNNGFLMDVVGSATVNSVTFTGTTISGNKATGIQVLPNQDTGSTPNLNSFIVSNCTIQNNNLGADFSTFGNANLTFKFLNNANMTGHQSHAINVNAAVPSSGTVRGTIQGNSIGNAAVAGSGSAIGSGIRVAGNNAANLVLLIDNNVIGQCPNGRGIDIQGRNGAGRIDATVTGNIVTPNDASGFPLSAIFVQSNVAGTAGYTVRSDVRNNTVPAGTTSDLGPGFIALVETGASVSELVDSPPGSASATSQLSASNTGSVSANAGVALIPGPINTPP